MINGIKECGFSTTVSTSNENYWPVVLHLQVQVQQFVGLVILRKYFFLMIIRIFPITPRRGNKPPAQGNALGNWEGGNRPVGA